MTNEKKIYLCEQIANRLWSATMGLSAEAGRAGNFGKGYAVVAHETRIIAERLFDAITAAKFDGGTDALFAAVEAYALELGYLSVNGELEILRVVETDNVMSNNKAIMVCMDEVLKVAYALNEIVGKEIWKRPTKFAEIPNPIRSGPSRGVYVCFNIGGIAVIEHNLNVAEVFYGAKMDDKGENMIIRGDNLPIVDMYKRFGLSRPAHIGGHNPNIAISVGDKTVAVPIDGLDRNVIMYSPIGQNISAAGHPFAEYARECWDSGDGGQLVFIDWEKMI